MTPFYTSITKLLLVKWAIFAAISYLLYLQVSWLITFLIIILSIQVTANIILLSVPAFYKSYIEVSMKILKNKPEDYVKKFLTTDWIGFSILFFGVLASGSIYLLVAYFLFACITEVIVRPAISEAYYG